MKSNQGCAGALFLFALLFFLTTAWSLWHMAGLYDRIYILEEYKSNE
jgi:glucose dehydrogenase